MENKAIAGNDAACILQSKEQAKLVLYHLFELHPLQDFEDNLLAWLRQLPPAAYAEYCRLPALLKKGRNWALGNNNTPALKGPERMQQLAALFGYLVTFMEQCWLLYGRDIYEKRPVNWNFDNNPASSILHNLMAVTTPQHVIHLLHGALVAVTGKEYMDTLLKKLKQLESASPEEREKFSSNPATPLHTKLVVAFAHFRCLVEANWLLLGA